MQVQHTKSSNIPNTVLYYLIVLYCTVYRSARESFILYTKYCSADFFFQRVARIIPFSPGFRSGVSKELELQYHWLTRDIKVSAELGSR